MTRRSLTGSVARLRAADTPGEHIRLIYNYVSFSSRITPTACRARRGPGTQTAQTSPGHEPLHDQRGPGCYGPLRHGRNTARWRCGGSRAHPVRLGGKAFSSPRYPTRTTATTTPTSRRTVSPLRRLQLVSVKDACKLDSI